LRQKPAGFGEHFHNWNTSSKGQGWQRIYRRSKGMRKSSKKQRLAAAILLQLAISSSFGQADAMTIGIEINANKMLHVVVGYNTKKMIIISAYRPDDEHFEKNGKTRKGR
jgi:hypothetical protein